MTTIIHCSICSADLANGARICAKCGLPVTNQGIASLPADRKGLRLSALSWLVLIVGIGFLSLYVISKVEYKRDSAKDSAAQRAEDQARTAHRALADSLSTEGAFMRRCGEPTATHHGISPGDARDTDPALLATATTFVYKLQGTTMDVIFVKDSATPLLFREHLDRKIYSFAPYDGLIEMGCLKAAR